MIEPCVDVPGRKRQRLIVTCQRFRVAAEARQCSTAVIVDRGAFRARRQGIVERGERLLVALERIEDNPVVDQRVGCSGLRLKRGSDQAQTFDRTTLLVLEDAAKVQRVKIVRLAVEHGLVDSVRFLEASLPVQREGLVDERRSLQALPGYMLGHGVIHGEDLPTERGASLLRGAFA